jgi:hypothetical protein
MDGLEKPKPDLGEVPENQKYFGTGLIFLKKYSDFGFTSR